ncbi:hypothetical protein B0A52_01907 [Exophiala mesophila]|uniref:O-methyltransferase C-terminal domain-containing protein n=1 Tax=Exophiala mesophila TaxID=212818 RepID=A0A438NEC8_EXOME|nr:hypothetical protein B0A52_01907 [Exophiala mesophila]
MSLSDIAEDILACTSKIDRHANLTGRLPTSFDQDTLGRLPEDVEDARKTLIDKTQELRQLALGPVGLCLDVLFSFTDLLSFRFVYQYSIAAHVPRDGDISYEDLGQATKVDPVLVRRFLQHVMMNRIFEESRPGYVKHTAVSRLLHDEPGAVDTAGFILEDLTPSSTKVMEALELWPGSQEPNQTGFNYAFATQDSFYHAIAKDPERSRRFGECMRFFTRGSMYDIQNLVVTYPWNRWDSPGFTLVDCGGGHGSVSIALAGETSNLKFIVQDLEGTAQEGERSLSSSLKDRVSFMKHDFFTEQPVRGADLYFFRFIFHNWADKYAAQILKNLVPAMKDGARVLIYEFFVPENADPLWTRKQCRNLDMIQALGWNSLERTVPDWKSLVEKTDPRFRLTGVYQVKNSPLVLIEAVFMEVPTETKTVWRIGA